MKRILCLLCILALALGLFAACGKSDPPPTPPVNNDITTEGDVAPPANNGGDTIENFSDLAQAMSGLGQVFSAEWPENEYTKQVPKPKFDVGLGTLTGEGYVVLCGATIPELRDYVKDLQQAGFSKNASTTDESVFGMTVFAYEADNGKGYRVELGNAMGMSTITVSKIG